MKVELVNAPAPIVDQNQGQNSARDRAIAKLMGGQQQALPVQNASQVAPEEMGALGTVKKDEDEEIKGQSNVAEASPEQESPKEATDPAKEKLLSTQYAQLARREKALYAKAQAREQALAAREQELQSREAAIKAKDTDYQSNFIPKSRLTEDTISVLLENGISYDQITQLALNQTNQDPTTKAAIQKLEMQIKAQEEARESDRKAYAEQQNQSYQQALKQIRLDTKQLVDADPNFEAIKATNSIKDVVDLIEQTFKEDGVLLSVEEACQQVEDHLVEKLSNYSSQINKVQQRLNAAKTAPKQSAQGTPQQPKPTLTNAVGSSKKLSAKDRAILAFKGELHKK